MYSKALAILDRNTEIYMCEELKKEKDKKPGGAWRLLIVMF